VYRGLQILTNQPASPTRLVAIRELSREFSVGEYAELAHREIDRLVMEHGVAVVSGGTGLYLRAALVDLELPPPVENGARARWEALYDEDHHAAFARTELGTARGAGASETTTAGRSRAEPPSVERRRAQPQPPVVGRYPGSDCRRPRRASRLVKRRSKRGPS
jgi:hypothetical protein